jgi:hypothetical protein
MQWRYVNNEWQVKNNRGDIVRRLYGNGSSLMNAEADLCPDVFAALAEQTVLLRRVRYYAGWIAMPRSHIDKKASEKDWVFMRNLRFHNAGYRQPIIDNDGTPTAYEVELAQLTYQNTRTPILVLKIFEKGNPEALSYSWARRIRSVSALTCVGCRLV